MEQIAVQVPDGEAKGRLFLPHGAGPWPVIVFYNDAGGSRPAMWEMGQRLADAGYAVIQPDFYWRSGEYAEFDGRTAFANPDERARLGALMSTVRMPQVVSDTEAFLQKLNEDSRFRTDRIGAVGYCMGGRMAFVFATAEPRVAAIAGIHAGGLVTDKEDSPHLAAGKIRGAVYLGVAANDSSCTEAHQETLRAALSGKGIAYVLENYAARHGWAVTDFPVYDREAAERHWERIFELFDRTLTS